MKRTGKRTLWEGGFIRTVEITYEDRTGTPRTWEAVERVNCAGVVICVPITTDNRILLIRQYRPVLDRYVIELPAGLIDLEEDPFKACRRELIEETGYYSDNIVKLSDCTVSTGMNSEIWVAMAAPDCRKATPELLAGHPPDPTEFIEVIPVAMDALYDYLLSCQSRGDLTDVRILGLVELAKARLGLHDKPGGLSLMEGLLTRRSVRKFTQEPVSRDHLLNILEAGRWAPSGLNNQPWRFAIVTDEAVRLKMSECTKYAGIIKSARALIALFIDKNDMYNATKDHQGLGACAENMLLAAHGLGLGGVWLGEILNKAEEVRSLLELPENLELMCVLALGHPTTRSHRSERKEMKDLIVRDI